jgi:glutamine---fructose-6-phosphate transaminase (isomerizing)
MIIYHETCHVSCAPGVYHLIELAMDEDTMAPKNGLHTYTEIMSQGEVWLNILENSDEQVEKMSGWTAQKHDELLFIGCGSTHYLSLSAAKVWTSLTNEPARGLPSSEVCFYSESNLPRQKQLLVAVSRSGETTETIKAVDFFREVYSGDPLIISCYPDSSLAAKADLKLLAPEAQEASVAQTRSFSSMYILAEMLAGYTAKNKAFIEDLYKLPRLFSGILGKFEPLIKGIAQDPKYEHFVFLGSGINYGLANEVMLKMKEMSTSVSEAYHFMEFRHGPMSMITDRSLVIGLVSDSRKSEESRVLQDMHALGASTMALVNQKNGLIADYILEFDSPISDAARSVLNLPLLQLLGYYHSLSKGLNPDQPTNLQSVVLL